MAKRASGVDRGFTEHEHDDELGLVNMKGRIFDPRLGRFLSADPVVAFPFRGQAYNRYAYVLNPLRYTDPTGFTPGSGSSDAEEWNELCRKFSECTRIPRSSAPKTLTVVAG